MICNVQAAMEIEHLILIPMVYTTHFVKKKKKKKDGARTVEQIRCVGVGGVFSDI